MRSLLNLRVAFVALILTLSAVPPSPGAEPFAVETAQVKLAASAIDSLGNTYYVGTPYTSGDAKLVKIGVDGRTVLPGKILAGLTEAVGIAIGRVEVSGILTERLFVLGNNLIKVYDLNGDAAFVGASGNISGSATLGSGFRARDIAFYAKRNPITGVSEGFLYVCGEDRLRARAKRLPTATMAIDRDFGFGFRNEDDGDRAHALALDDAGNVYLAGRFSGSGSVQEGSLGGWRQTIVPVSNWGNTANWLGWASWIGFWSPDVHARTVQDINFDNTRHALTSGGTGGNPPSGQYLTNVQGQFDVPTAGNYYFRIGSDDGYALVVDGISVVNQPARGVYTNVVHGPRFLTKGAHSFTFLHYEAGGAAKAKVEISTVGSNSSFSLMRSPTIGLPHPDSPFIMKLSENLSALDVYSPDDVEGAYYDIAYGDGWLYATGTVSSAGRTVKVNGTSRSLAKEAEIVRVDTQFTDATSAYVFKTQPPRVFGTDAPVGEGLGVTADEEGNVYVTGGFGAGATSFLSPGSPDPTEFERLTSSVRSRYVAKLNDKLHFEWVWDPGSGVPTFGGGFFGAPSHDTENPALSSDFHGVMWHPDLKRLFWNGVIENGLFTVGSGDETKIMSGPGGAIVVFEPNSDLSRRAQLSVGSLYGQSGQHVRPFSGNPNTPASDKFLVGVELTVETEPFIYEREDGSGGFEPIPTPTQQNIEEEAVVRRRSLGYIIDDVATTTGRQSHTFILDRDQKIEFLWETDYALEIGSDLSSTLAADGSSLESGASGRPVPEVLKHWIPEGDPVAPEIDTAVGGFTAAGGRLRFVVHGYSATGAANASGVPGIIPFLGGEGDLRRRVAEFAMTAPATLEWKWKRQYAVQVSTSGPSTTDLPVVHPVGGADDLGASPSPTLVTTNADRFGSDAIFFDAGASVFIGTRYQDSAAQFQLRGWTLGDGHVFVTDGDLGDLETATLDGVDYRGKFIGSLSSPVRVQWLYNEPRFFENVTIGSPIRFSGVTDPTLLAAIDTSQRPELELIDGPFGTRADDMIVWDEVTGRAFPVRPGIIRTVWSRLDLPNAKITVDVTASFSASGANYYPHIASTPAVEVDRVGDGLVLYDVPYVTGDGVVNPPVDPSVVEEDNTIHEFTATQAGRTVLVYRWISENAANNAAGSLRVRVVETEFWDDNLQLGTATVGERVTSAFDEAGLGTGYLFFERARYNVNLHNREAVEGPIYPVNLEFTSTEEDDFVVVWYTERDGIIWPHQAVSYDVEWPAAPPRIVIASEFGSESAPAGTDPDAQQLLVSALTVTDPDSGVTTDHPDVFTFDPSRLQGVKVYNQPDPALPGYNPNEEHALIAPSLRFASVAPRPVAAYALRDGDLNVTNEDQRYTSEPYVLVEFTDAADGLAKMKVFGIERDDPALGYGFEKEMEAGEPVIPFYPLGVVNGATPCEESFGVDGAPSLQQVYWEDHRGNSYAVSAGRYPNGDPVFFDGHFFYRMLPDFAWPMGTAIAAELGQILPGDCLAFLTGDTGNDYPTKPYPTVAGAYENPMPVRYFVEWPEEVPILKVGETLTYAGGEYRADNPFSEIPDGEGGVRSLPTPGLPGVVGWAAGRVVFDSLNPAADPALGRTRYTARLYPGLSARSVDLDVSLFPQPLLPANGRVRVDGGKYVFSELPASLQRRVTYDPLDGKLIMVGILNDKTIGDPTLTASPGAVYTLEPNILTREDRDRLLDLARDNSSWVTAVNNLYKLTRNPNLIDSDFVGGTDLVETWRNFVRGAEGSQQIVSLANADNGYFVGLSQQVVEKNQEVLKVTDPFGIDVRVRDPRIAVPDGALGPGLALSANPDFLNPNDLSLPDVSYVTVAENDDPALEGNPVTLHVIKVDRRERYRGAIKVIYSDNVFDEATTLRHTGDFAASANDLVFEWWYRIADGSDFPPPERAGSPNPWKIYPDPTGQRGAGLFGLTVEGTPNAPEALLADSLWFVRYRHKNEPPGDVVRWDNLEDRNGDPIWEWAGAGNSTPQDQDGDGFPDYRAQLLFGWVKRVLDGINVYEARIRDFSGEAPATYADIIRQLGQRFEGPVALNPDKNVIENTGMIELYATVLKRARDLSIDLSTPVSTDGITIALQLAATRLSDFYQLLGDEAYVDALDPTIGHGSSSADYGHLAPAVHAFQNQTSNLLEEELALLRGVDDFFARPIYNRLMPNFTKAEGEAAYATNYDLFDANRDGFVDEDDSAILFPQGHGDAWGHYLTAVRGQYDLLRHPFFNWVSRSEQYALNDIVFKVDFLDERKFAEAAAKKAKAGAQIVDLTHRLHYSSDPAAQWRGYNDVDGDRSWGVEGWARRAGIGSYMDWVTANALLPAEHPNEELEGIQKIDRTTNEDIPVISANLNYIQSVFNDANNGHNPLGVAGNAVPFDINPALLDRLFTDGNLHFEQVYARAVTALKNAKATFDYSNRSDNLLRKTGTSADDFALSVTQEDRSFRDQLIDFFGRPYPGTVGAGRAYPEGYVGPDTMLYMYVETRELNNQTVPGQAAYFEGNLADFNPNNLVPPTSSGFAEDITFMTERVGAFFQTPNSYRERYASSFAGTNLTDILRTASDANFHINYTDLDPANRGLDLANLEFPVTAAGYTFQAPPAWGQRPHYGKLQVQIQKMMLKEADLFLALWNYSGYLSELSRTIRLLDAKTELDQVTRNLKITDLVVGQVAAGTQTGLGIAANVADTAADFAEGIGDAFKEAIPDILPTAGLAVSPGDILGAAQSGILSLGETTKAGLKATSLSLGIAKDVIGFLDQLKSALIGISIEELERNYGTKSELSALETMIGNEAGNRITIFKELEALQQLSDEYRSLVSQAQLLLDKREAYNKKVAGIVQRERYQDMTFRVSRNEALQKYHEAFELAARYAYLAAKAYDYETNLSPTHPASAQPLIEEIIRSRTIGLVDGDPQTGAGGLADVLARMKANFGVIHTQLGINNPQSETGRFSLRREHFRLTEDNSWEGTLQSHIVEDLWEVSDFRRYCRPFAAELDGGAHLDQPGIVIEFDTSIIAGENFFGEPLLGGDSAYDASNFATKVRAAGVWFENYDNTRLAETPRVYLVPAGLDIMTVPTSNQLQIRLWDVLDQTVPVPFPSVNALLDEPTYRPSQDSLLEPEGTFRRFSSFRAHGFSAALDEGEMTWDNRLVGRSAWNTRWVLIIPGLLLGEDPLEAVYTFAKGPRLPGQGSASVRDALRDSSGAVKDIRLFFKTYGYSGG